MNVMVGSLSLSLSLCACVCVDLFRLTRQALPLAGLQQDGPLSVQRPGLAALTQVRLWDVLPVDAHAVDVLPCTGAGREEERASGGFTVSLFTGGATLNEESAALKG